LASLSDRLRSRPNTSAVPLYYLGNSPSIVAEKRLKLTQDVPPFKVDAVLVYGEELSVEEKALLAKYERHGRSVHQVLEGESDFDYLLTGQPETNYHPINCNFYDNFEAAIVQRRTVDLAYRMTDDSVMRKATRLRDLKTHQTEEYVLLADGEWLRMDRVVSVDGVEAGASCRF
jgi:transcriptional antiterminator Rof (Rho-off)